MGACASKPKDFDRERIPPVAPATPRKPDPETLPQEDEKAGETNKEESAVEPSDSAEGVAAAAADVVPDKVVEAVKEEKKETIAEVVIDKTETTTSPSEKEEIKTELPIVDVR